MSERGHELTSINFTFLHAHDPRLTRLGALAERLVHLDPNTSLVKLRQFGELLALSALPLVGQAPSPLHTQHDRLRMLRDAGTPGRVTSLFHALRDKGNKANHEFAGDFRDAVAMLKKAHQLAVWFHRAFGADPHFAPSPFALPEPSSERAAQLQAQVERLRARLEDLDDTLSATRDQAERDRLQAEEARARARFEADERALIETLHHDDTAELREERDTWQRLAEETEEHNAALAAHISTLRAQLEQLSDQQVEANVSRLQVAADRIPMTEAETRERIDAQLRRAGWRVDARARTWQAGARPSPDVHQAIAEVPTDDGRADYVLYLGEAPVAVIEAKRRADNVRAALDQARRYARALRDPHPDGPWPDDADPAAPPYRAPLAFATNGRDHLPQLTARSGIWFTDLRRPAEGARVLADWPTPEGLARLLARDVAAADARLRAVDLDAQALRPYQRDAIAAVNDAVVRGQRRALLAMATGTGKTRVALFMIHSWLKAGRFERVLFLVDRRSLGDQARDTFCQLHVEPGESLHAIYGVVGLDDDRDDDGGAARVHIATIQGLTRRLLDAPDDAPRLPIDRYDAIIIDECHRGYTLDREMSERELRLRAPDRYLSRYRRALDHFDAFQLGLTATPALHTSQIFGRPVYTYSYRRAVLDGHLCDQDPPIIYHTEHNTDGLTIQRGEPLVCVDRRSGEVVDVEMPDEVRFEVESFNNLVVTDGFNRLACELLADHLDPAVHRKVLIFAVRDDHADDIVTHLDAALRARHDRLHEDAVVKITSKADRPDQLLRRLRNERWPWIAVTVDLLTTGVDVPPIDTLVFLRRVNSRILYDQMIGRATRLSENKDHFEVLDFVHVTTEMAERDATDMRPVAARPHVTFTQLVAEVCDDALRVDDRAASRDELVGRLRRLTPRLEAPLLRELTEGAGVTEPAQLFEHLRDDLDAAAPWLARHAPLFCDLDRVQTRAPSPFPGTPISTSPDTLIAVTRGAAPADYLERFNAFIHERLNDVDALRVVATRPRELTHQRLREVAEVLASEGFNERRLTDAWKQTSSREISAGLIGFIRQAALGDALIPYRQRLDAAAARLLARPSWSPEQRQWLERIISALRLRADDDHTSPLQRLDGVVEPADLDQGNFQRRGGFAGLDRLFGGQLADLLHDLTGEIWAANTDALPDADQGQG